MNGCELDNPACCGGEGFSIQCVDLYKTAQARFSGAFRCTCFFSLPSCNFLCGLLVGIGASAFFFFTLLLWSGWVLVFSSILIVYGVRALFYPVYSLLGGPFVLCRGCPACKSVLCCAILCDLVAAFYINYHSIPSFTYSFCCCRSGFIYLFCFVFARFFFRRCFQLLFVFATFCSLFFAWGDTKDVHDGLNALSLALEEGEVAI